VGLNSGMVYLVDFSHVLQNCDTVVESRVPKHNDPEVLLRLGSHEGEVSCVQWSDDDDFLVSCGHDGKVFVWPISDFKRSSERSVVPSDCPLYSLPNPHERYVNSVSWQCRSSSVFSSVGHDGFLKVWDTRIQSSGLGAQICSQVSQLPLMSVSCNTEYPHILVCGGYDKVVRLMDIRSPTKALNSFDYHLKPVTKVQFHPAHPAFFLSVALDRRVCFWDISHESRQSSMTRLEKLDGPVELITTHGGHTSICLDASLNPLKDAGELIVASVDAVNLLHVWTVPESVIADEEDMAN